MYRKMNNLSYFICFCSWERPNERGVLGGAFAVPSSLVLEPMRASTSWVELSPPASPLVAQPRPLPSPSLALPLHRSYHRGRSIFLYPRVHGEEVRSAQGQGRNMLPPLLSPLKHPLRSENRPLYPPNQRAPPNPPASPVPLAPAPLDGNDDAAFFNWFANFNRRRGSLQDRAKS